MHSPQAQLEAKLPDEREPRVTPEALFFFSSLLLAFFETFVPLFSCAACFRLPVAGLLLLSGRSPFAGPAA